MKGLHAYLMALVCGVAASWTTTVLRQGPVDGESFRLVKDGVVLWQVEPKRGGAAMTFFVKGKPVIEVLASEAASAINLRAAEGDAEHSLVAAAIGASTTMTVGSGRRWTHAFINKKGEPTTWHSTVDLGEMCRREVMDEEGVTLRLKSRLGAIELAASNDVLRQEMSTKEPQRTASLRMDDEGGMLEWKEAGKTVRSLNPATAK